MPPTNTGTTARLISAYRPQAPVLALSPSRDVVRRCQLLWGVAPVLHEEPMETLDLIEACARRRRRRRPRRARATRSASPPACPPARAGGTNLFKVHTLESRRGPGLSSPERRRSRKARAFSTFPQESMLHQRPERFFDRS